MWIVEYTNEFGEWWDTLSDRQRQAITEYMAMLEEQGPILRRPTVATIKGSRHRSMKELRVSAGGALRVLFSFDPRRQVILLFGGDKSGRWKEWYKWAIPIADDLYDTYLQELRREGLIR